MNIGVLALQGGVIEHINAINKLGLNGIEVKGVEDLNNIDAIILPGGESTTIGNLLNVTGLMEPLKEKIQKGLPTWGTCAGMILLAKEIDNDSRRHLQLMDIKVKRNAFGSQIDSFKRNTVIPAVSEQNIELVFIRAPYITETGNNVEILSKLDGNIIAARQNNMLATSFHPELTEDTAFLKYFINICKNKNC